MSEMILLSGSHPYHNKALQLFEDPEIIRLQTQIKFLVQELAGLQQLKSGVEQEIELLHTRHHQELRPLVVELLQLRRNYHRKTDQPDEELPEVEAEAAPDQDEAGAEAEAQPDSKLLPAQRRALKEMFRQASKLCHPDLVAEAFKAEASVIFIELKTAYEQHNLQRVEEILHILERGEKLSGQSSLSRSKDKLRSEVRYLRSRIQALRQEIEVLKQSSSYKKLSNIEDWDDYFDDLKAELQRKINRLKRKKNGRGSS